MNIGISVPLPAYEVETSCGTLDTLAQQAGRDPAGLTISVYGQAPEHALCQRFHDAGATLHRRW